MELELTLSGNDIGVPQEVPVDSQVDNLILTVYIEGPDYTESLDNLSGQLDRIIELLEYQQEMMISQNALDEKPEEEEEKEIVINVTVSENTVSENTVSENALLTTKLTEYSLTDSLLLVICLLLLFFIVVSLFFRKGESN